MYNQLENDATSSNGALKMMRAHGLEAVLLLLLLRRRGGGGARREFPKRKAQRGLESRETVNDRYCQPPGSLLSS